MPVQFDLHALLQMEDRKRATLINKLAGYKTANLIGTRSAKGAENLAIFNSVVHIGANPPYLGFILRPMSVERHTYKNLEETGVYTINMVTEGTHREAHKTSGKFAEGVSEFEACGFQPWYLDGFPAPFVAESPVKVGLSFVEAHTLACNGTRLVVGKIEHLVVPEDALAPDGDLDLEALGAVAIGGLDTYYKGVKLGRYGYFRPGEPLQEIS